MGTSGNITREPLSPKGLMEMFVTKGRPKLVLDDKIANSYNLPIYRTHNIDCSECELLETIRRENIIVNVGKDSVIRTLATGLTLEPLKVLARLAVGDNGALPSDTTTPKTPLADRTTLYNEVGRADADAMILTVATPAGTIHEVRLVKTFTASDFPITSFFNQAKPMLNEVGIIMIDPTVAPLPRAANYAGVSPFPLSDEALFAIRTHKSVPFEAANDISVTIRYTIYIE